MFCTDVLISPYMKKCVLIAALLGIVALSSGQEKLLEEASFSGRAERIRLLPPDPEFTRALQLADSLSLSVRQVYPDGRITAIRRFSPSGHPIYLHTHNKNALATISTKKVQPGGGQGFALEGEGMLLGIWDGGLALGTHQEFGSRVREMNPTGSLSGHATHVAGTMAASGLDGDARGMAPAAEVESYDWDQDLQEMEVAARDGLLVSNHSYGFILGFDYDTEEKQWKWWGDRSVSETEDYLFGYYHEEARAYDQLALSYPYYLIVKSAGNDRGEAPSGSEHYVWESGEWVVSSEKRDKDGGEDGFGSIGPVAGAKNILAVGAVGDLPGGYTIPEAVKIQSYSVFGPTDDGRIKPDILTNGESLFSAYSGSDEDYRSSSGTSMAAPGASGSLILLQELYHSLHNTYMRSASLKGLVLHTADDAGNPGPDYSFGWGLMNTLSAAELLADTAYDNLREFSLSQGATEEMNFFCDGSSPVKVTLCWTDVPGQVPAATLNPTDRILVNDLDVRVERSLDGMEYLPWVLNPVNPSENASRGDNVLDNVEQVYIGDPEKGFYRVVVSHKGQLVGESQRFSVVVSGLKEEYFASGTTELQESNGSFILTSAGVYLPDMEAAWHIDPGNGMSPALSFSLFETEPGKDLLHVYDGDDETAPLLATLSGTLANEDTVIRATGTSMFVSFSSDAQNQFKGLRANYCTVAPEGNFLIQGKDYPCTASSETYLVSGQGGTFYSWQAPGDWVTEDSGENHVRFTIGSQGGFLSVLPSNNCGEGEVTALEILPLNSPPRLAGFSGDTVLCAGTGGMLSVDSLPGATYQWTLPGDWLGQSKLPSIQFIPSTQQGTPLVSVRNSCGAGDTLAIPVLVKNIPETHSIYSLVEPICKQSTAAFSFSSRNGEWYQWSVEGDWEILSGTFKDTVNVKVGNASNYLFLKATNECGFRNSNRFFQASDLPDSPLMAKTESEYEDVPAIEISNSTSFSSIQWYRDGEMLDSPDASGARYLAFVPGLYGVMVSNREGCVLMQEETDWIDTRESDRLYAAHGGREGEIVIHNSLSENALINVYDLHGHLVLIETAGPGRTEIHTRLKGVYVVQISGQGEIHSSRVFVH